MKHTHRWMTLLALLCVTAFAHGHGGDSHDDEVFLNKQTAAARGETILNAMIAEKKLPESWQQKTLGTIEAAETPKGGRQWILQFNNPAEPDSKKQSVYIFLDEVGNFVGANHSGQ